MQRHTKNYMSAFGYKVAEEVFCEVCGSMAVDIHHVIPRSKFGKKRKDEQDDVKNLIALCRLHHDHAHANLLTAAYLMDIVYKRKLKE